jgi:transposase
MSDNDEVLLQPFKRGYRRLRMITDLAHGKLLKREIAEKYGISETAVYKFQAAHRDAIEAQKEDLENEFAALWVADKKNRVAEYQADVELINERLESGVDQEQVYLKVKHSALRGVAEELGHLNPKDGTQAAKVEVTIRGVDGDAI